MVKGRTCEESTDWKDSGVLLTGELEKFLQEIEDWQVIQTWAKPGCDQNQPASFPREPRSNFDNEKHFWS